MKTGVIRNISVDVAKLLWKRQARRNPSVPPCPTFIPHQRIDLAVDRRGMMGWGSVGLDPDSLENWGRGASNPLTVEDFL